MLLAARASAAPGRTLVVFTIDVESNDTFRLPDQIDAVCTDGSACGLMEIARLLTERRWSGTFFLNVYEHPKWGLTAMRNVAVRLQAAGQDVALHTHPETVFDSSRTEMFQYSLDEQTSIIRDGVQLLTKWTGRPVVAHRAGDYSADEHTLIALERNGVLLDSSMFWRHPHSGLDALGLPRNLPAWHGRVAEIPVTVYQREDRPKIFGAAFAPATAVRKIDPNWFVNGDEVRTAIDALVAADVPVIVVFLHSFSFLAAPTAGGPPLADRHAIDMFRTIADHVASNDLPVVTMRELAGRELRLASRDNDVVPRVTVRVDFSRFVWRRIKASDRFSLSVEIGITLLATGAVFVLVRRRKANETRAREPGPGGASPAPSGVRSR